MEFHRACANTIKGLAMDAVEAANSGHPGMPLGMADVATVLWTQFLVHDPADPAWPDRDRFVLSAGHGSTLLYALLHLSGYDLSLNDLRQFRQWGSKTPGHPEVGHTAGVETTTGPLGQGFANGVGMAIAERFLRETYGADLTDHFIYGIVSDGDLMEGVSQEAASIAGHLGLGKIVYLYDSNAITIDGATDLSFTENVAARFQAYGWHVETVDGHDARQVAEGIRHGRAEAGKPSLIICRTRIGHGCRLEGSEKTHGSPLGKEEVRWTKANLGLDPDAQFAVPASVYAAFRAGDGAQRHATWRARLETHPKRSEFLAALQHDTRALADTVAWPTFNAGEALATRKSSQACLKAITAAAPWVLGGSADLAGSNGTDTGKPVFSATRFSGSQTLAFGVREHGMAAICNGMALHGGVLPYCATFLVFHDYMRPSVRLSCLMQQQVVYIYTHDSIFLGEDGPTHQPVETLIALRSIPGIRVLRPADAQETVEAWKLALRNTTGPTALVLTRQNLPTLDRSHYGAAESTARGAYLLDSDPDPQVVLIATGSEVTATLQAAAELRSEGRRVRVVSMPCRELFLEQDTVYRRALLPSDVPRVSIEAATTWGWERVVGDNGIMIGIDRFGASAPDKVLAEKFGFTPKQIAETVRRHLAA